MIGRASASGCLFQRADKHCLPIRLTVITAVLARNRTPQPSTAVVILQSLGCPGRAASRPRRRVGVEQPQGEEKGRVGMGVTPPPADPDVPRRESRGRGPALVRGHSG